VALATGAQSPPNARAASGPAGGADVELPGGVIDGSFDVGGHKLYMRCQGTGSPTVVYLHGYIHDPSGGGSASAGTIPDLLATRNRVCVYDRANVGRSEPVAGPLRPERGQGIRCSWPVAACCRAGGSSRVASLRTVRPLSGCTSRLLPSWKSSRCTRRGCPGTRKGNSG
jgi:hypothetical protein